MKNYKVIIVLFILCIVVLGLTACDGIDDYTKIAFKQNELTCNVGDSVNLSEFMELKGIQLANVKFTSSNESVLSIVDNIATALSEGVADITAVSGLKSAKCRVTVVETQSEQHMCNHICEICGKCMDADCSDAVCEQKCLEHGVTIPTKMTEEEWRAFFNHIIENKLNFTVELASPVMDYSGKIMYATDRNHFFIMEDGQKKEWYQYLSDGVLYDYEETGDGKWIRKENSYGQISELGDFGIVMSMPYKYELCEFSDGIYSMMEDNGEKKTLKLGDNDLVIRLYREENGEFIEYGSYHYYDFGTTHIDLPEAEDYVEPTPTKMTEEEWRAKIQFLLDNKYNFSEEAYPIANKDKIVVNKFSNDKKYLYDNQGGYEKENYWQLVDGNVYEYSKTDDGKWIKTCTDKTKLDTLVDFDLFEIALNNYSDCVFEDGKYSLPLYSGATLILFFEGDDVCGIFCEEVDGFIRQNVGFRFYDMGNTQITLPEADDYVESTF